MELCDYLKKMREVHELTQNELSNRLALKRSTYSAYETGRLAPPLAVLYAITELYQIPLEVFMKEIEYNGNSLEDRDEKGKDYQMEQELLHYYYSCNRQKRAKIQRYMSFIQKTGD